MEPENDSFQKESPFPGTSFQVPWGVVVFSRQVESQTPLESFTKRPEVALPPFESWCPEDLQAPFFMSSCEDFM